MPEYTIFIAADHRGFEKKEALFPLLNECHENVHAEDLGPESYDKDDDYNDAAVAVARAVLQTKNSFGVLICGSAHGVTMQANRFKGIRAIAAYNEPLAKIGREHDDANLLCLSADFTAHDPDQNFKIAQTFLATPRDESPRYLRRIAKLNQYGEDR